MAIIKNYNRQYHDLYKYFPQISYSPIVSGVPIEINKECEAVKAGVDFTGCAVRDQRYNNRYSPNTIPGVVWDDVNFWNNGYFSAVLITPRHALVCEHYYIAVPSQVNLMRWLGKSGQFYSREVSKTKPMGNDLRLVEFKQEFPSDVKVYNRIADIRYIPRGKEMWIQDAQNRIYRVKLNYTRTNDNAVSGMPIGWYASVYNDDGLGYNEGYFNNGQATSPNVFRGDSGSPTFILDDGETILVGLAYGGSFISPALLNELKFETGGAYSLELVKVSAKKEDFNQDGKVSALDLGALLSKWETSDPIFDLNKDGKVDAMDMTVLQASWGEYNMENSVQQFSNSIPSSSQSSDSVPEAKKR